MAAGGFGPYHHLWADDAPSKRIGVTPTPWAMMPALGFVPYHRWRVLWRTPPQQCICRLDFFGKKNRPKTMNMHLMATNPSSKSDDGTNEDDEANAGGAGGADKDRVGGTGGGTMRLARVATMFFFGVRRKLNNRKLNNQIDRRSRR